MQHANDIQKFDHSVEVVIYPCRYCYGLHVARAKAKRRHKAGLDKIRLMLASPGFRAKAPQEVQEKFERLEKELTRLCEK